MFIKGMLKIVLLWITTALFFTSMCVASGTLTPDFRMFSSYNNPVVEMDFFASGYSDWMYWGYNQPRHPFSRHEMLSGEWAAAIYYEGIPTYPDSMWLTHSFSWPTWTTNSNLQTVSFNCWDNSANPIDGFDTAQSIISNNQVRITINYEMVDLGQQGMSGQGGSPMTFGDFLVKSERYVLLQTYTITNITANPIDNLEFYQMLHGHPGDEYAAKVNSVYSTTYRDDPLENYTPFNPVHTVGNFRYDITQWNNLEGSATGVSHRDWIGFGSTIEPTWVENGTYAGGHFPGEYSRRWAHTSISRRVP